MKDKYKIIIAILISILISMLFCTREINNLISEKKQQKEYKILFNENKKILGQLGEYTKKLQELEEQQNLIESGENYKKNLENEYNQIIKEKESIEKSIQSITNKIINEEKNIENIKKYIVQ